MISKYVERTKSESTIHFEVTFTSEVKDEGCPVFKNNKIIMLDTFTVSLEKREKTPGIYIKKVM